MAIDDVITKLKANDTHAGKDSRLFFLTADCFRTVVLLKQSMPEPLFGDLKGYDVFDNGECLVIWNNQGKHWEDNRIFNGETLEEIKNEE